jgi:dolichol-phosphate mannosyltransferase
MGKQLIIPMAVAILLPTYNEEDGIGAVIDEIKKLKRSDFEIFVVDSGSTDKTISISEGKGARIIQLGIRGKGIAIKKAFSDLEHEYIVMIDSDNTYPVRQIPEVVEKLKDCDVVIGSRFKGSIEQGAMSTMNKVGNTMISITASALYLCPISDVCSGMWGYDKKAYKMLAERIEAPHLELECDMFAECAKRGFRICEIPIDYRKRAGETKLNALKYGFLDIMQLLKKRI